jgi:cyanate permease
MQWFRGREAPLINGLNSSATGVGNTIAMFATVYIASAFDWKLALAIFGGIALVLALAWLIWGKEHNEGTTEPKSIGPSASIGIGTALRQKSTLLLGLCMAGPSVIYMAIASWLPTYYHEVFGMPLSQAGSITGLFTLIGIPVSILGGLLPMRAGLRKPFLVVPGLIIGFAALGTFLIHNMAVIYTSIILFGICEWLYLPLIFTIAMELPGMSPPVAAIVIATALALGNLAGFFGPLIVGLLTDATGSYLPGMVVCSVLSWSLFVGGLLLPETGPKARLK